MTQSFLLIDFGASRIKSGVIDLTSKQLKDNYSSSGSSSVSDIVPNKFFSDALLEHLEIASKDSAMTGIVICCEMHGYFRSKAANPSQREYVSWRHSDAFNSEKTELINTDKYRAETGISFKRGLPISNLVFDKEHAAEQNQTCDVISFIPDEICQQLGNSNSTAHASLAHASGLYNLENKKLDLPQLERFSIPTVTTDDFFELGRVKFRGKQIPCFGGFGDLQASTLGVSPNNNDWLINIGTGSQIISLSQLKNPSFETRKYFKQKEISCFTHIPAGRSMNIIAEFLREVRDDKCHGYFWKRMSELSAKKCDNNGPRFDLRMFPEAHSFSTGGGITNIIEGRFSVDDFFSSLIFCFAKNYLDILKMVDANRERDILIGGNIPKQIPAFVDLIKDEWGQHVRLTTTNEEPSLSGLAKLTRPYL